MLYFNSAPGSSKVSGFLYNYLSFYLSVHIILVLSRCYLHLFLCGISNGFIKSFNVLKTVFINIKDNIDNILRPNKQRSSCFYSYLKLRLLTFYKHLRSWGHWALICQKQLFTGLWPVTLLEKRFWQKSIISFQFCKVFYSSFFVEHFWVTNSLQLFL